jgi:inner membrane protein involved in colicin E2 resistance
MTQRIAAIVFIFVCTAVAWIALGGTLLYRTYSANDALTGRVQSTWGVPQVQGPPAATYSIKIEKPSVVEENGKKVNRVVTEDEQIYLPLEASRVNVDLDLEHRQKGLLWYSTYKINFSGVYTFQNPASAEQEVTLSFPLPATEAVYDDVVMTANDRPLQLLTTKDALSGSIKLAAGKEVVLRVGYRSQGVDSWQYRLGDDIAEVRDFNLKVTANFDGFDFADHTLSPSEKKQAGRGWELTWSYRDLLSGYQIGLKMPEKLQPGPLSGRISFFAPVSLFFFFFLVFILTMLRGIDIHPMNYFFLACAFFAFHLLLAYLVDHISIHKAFIVCSITSLLLVWTYLRLVVGNRFAVEAALAQFGYLILFSYAFFFEGFTGLAITIGAILTLFIAMQSTAKIRWQDKFAKRPA